MSPVAELAALVAIAGGMGTGLVFLAKISMRMGSLLERLDGHIRVSDETAEDHEQRIRGLERGTPGGPGGRRGSRRDAGR